MLKTKEFADLCGTTKETLFHYDRIGLLKPAKVSSNGYRLWSPNQRAKFFLVSLLKESGCSLKEIERMCGNGTEAQTLSWLKQRKKQMKKQIASLKNGYSQLSELVNGMEALSGVSWGELHFEKCAAEKFRLVPLLQEIQDPATAEAKLIEILDASKKKIDPTIRPIGRLLERKTAETDSIRMLGFIFCAKSGKAGVALKMKSGKYAVWYTKGLPEAHKEELQKKITEIRNAGFKCASDIFVFDQPDISLNSSTEEQTAKYMVLVE
ncbi:MAG: MerR family DNA-binding transcriptional regulator [Burkholderiales bacterium]|nr:MerR family DNA-binding transcriptional regulator [Burkholderiales bacterium]